MIFLLMLWRLQCERMAGLHSMAMDSPDLGMKKVTVTVWWDGNANAVRMGLILAE